MIGIEKFSSRFAALWLTDGRGDEDVRIDEKRQSRSRSSRTASTESIPDSGSAS